jgi:hypothetical protein
MADRSAIARLGALLLVGSTAATASAQSEPTGAALAEALFREARRLYEAGDFTQACPKFAESHRLDPAGGTLLNLAVCHEAEGKLATAWAEYQEALAWAKREGRSDRVDVMLARLGELEPRLVRVSVVVPADARVPGLEISWDGTELAPAAWGVPMPVDPGSHRLQVRAPGRQPRLVELVVEGPGETKTVTVEPLAEAPVPPQSPAQRQAAPSPVQPERPAAAPASVPAAEQAETSTARTLAYVAGGVGVLSLGVGAYFGTRALTKMSDSDAECPDGRCSDRGAELSREAVAAAKVSNVMVGVGIVALGASIVLWLSSERPAATGPSGELAVLPTVDEDVF